MGANLPLRQREDQRLEFKGAGSLRKPFSISREVVAMLNAGLLTYPHRTGFSA